MSEPLVEFEVKAKRRIPLEQLHPARRRRRIIENLVIGFIGMCLIGVVIGLLILIAGWR